MNVHKKIIALALAALVVAPVCAGTPKLPDHIERQYQEDIATLDKRATIFRCLIFGVGASLSTLSCYLGLESGKYGVALGTKALAQTSLTQPYVGLAAASSLALVASAAFIYKAIQMSLHTGDMLSIIDEVEEKEKEKAAERALASVEFEKLFSFDLFGSKRVPVTLDEHGLEICEINK